MQMAMRDMADALQQAAGAIHQCAAHQRRTQMLALKLLDRSMSEVSGLQAELLLRRAICAWATAARQRSPLQRVTPRVKQQGPPRLRCHHVRGSLPLVLMMWGTLAKAKKSRCKASGAATLSIQRLHRRLQELAVEKQLRAVWFAWHGLVVAEGPRLCSVGEACATSPFGELDARRGRLQVRLQDQLSRLEQIQQLDLPRQMRVEEKRVAFARPRSTPGTARTKTTHFAAGGA